MKTKSMVILSLEEYDEMKNLIDELQFETGISFCFGDKRLRKYIKELKMTIRRLKGELKKKS